MSAAMSAGHSLVDMFASLGVTHFFGVPGESYLEVLDAVEHNPWLTLVSTRHESGASFMADAHGKLTGRPAVAMATRAPGAANLAVGVHTAFHDSTPMVVLVGQVDQSARGRDGFQEIDLQDFYRPITKWTTSLQNADHAAEVAYRAYVAATSGRAGPVLIELPADVLSRDTTAFGNSYAIVRPAGGLPPGTAATIRDQLARARRPVAIVGGGAAGARRELLDTSRKFGLGIYTAFRRQDVFPNDNPNYLGHLTLGTSPRVLGPLEEADVVLVLGSRLSEVTSQNFTLPRPTAAVIHINDDLQSVGAGHVPGLAVAADVRTALRDVLAGAGEDVVRPELRARHQIFLEESEPQYLQSETGVHPASVIRAMSEALPSDSIVASDAGNHSIFLHRYWCFRHPRTQLAPTSGAMGYAVPAAVAAKLSEPGRTVVAVVGDGGFLMTGQEIETSVRLGAPIIVVVMRNGLYGTIAMHQARAFGRTSGTDIGEVDLVQYARGLGANGVRVGNHKELLAVLDDAAFCSEVTTVIDAPIDPDVITPTGRLSEMLSAARS